MNEQERQAFEDLQEEVGKLKQEINSITRDKRKYANREVFESTITFKKPVFNRFGERVIN